MTRKDQMSDDEGRFPRFDETPAFDPDEFFTAFNFAMNAVAKSGVVSNPSDHHFNIRNDDNSVDEFTVTDTPMARIILAMKERYSDQDKAKYVGAGGRILALIGLVQDGKLSQWVRDGNDGTVEMHSVLVHAAATVRLTRVGTFPAREFIQTVKTLIKNGYVDTDFDKP